MHCSLQSTFIETRFAFYFLSRHGPTQRKLLVVTDYNKFMLGIDWIKGWHILCSKGRVSSGGRSFFLMMEVVVVNSYIL